MGGGPAIGTQDMLRKQRRPDEAITRCRTPVVTRTMSRTAGQWLLGAARKARLDAAVLVVAPLVHASACVTTAAVPVSGTIAGVRVESTADAEIARYYLEHYLPGDVTDAELHARIAELHRRYADRLPDRYELADLAAQTSNDFAGLFFAQLVSQQPLNRQFQARFARELRRLSATGDMSVDETPFEVVFVPAWLYIDRWQTGAKLTVPHDALAAAGVATHIVPVIQDAPIAQNAAIIADTIRDLAKTGKQYMLVTVSKSGAEVAAALSTLLTREESRHVRAWVNIAGALRGTPLVDELLDPPVGILMRPVFWVRGWNVDGASSLSPSELRSRFDPAKLPADLAVVNVVGVPVSGQLTEYGREASALLDPFGPHDGVTLIADSMVPGRPTIVGVGLDHYFRTPDMPGWAIALYKILASELPALTFVPPADQRPAASWSGDAARSMRLYCAGGDAPGGRTLCGGRPLPSWLD